jgi:hypothetical protein
VSFPQRVTREDWQKSIEQSISTFNGDAVEVSELLDALIGGLKNRYEPGDIWEIEDEYKELRELLKWLGEATGHSSKQDLAEWVADQEYGNNIEEGDFK